MTGSGGATRDPAGSDGSRVEAAEAGRHGFGVDSRDHVTASDALPGHPGQPDDSANAGVVRADPPSRLALAGATGVGLLTVALLVLLAVLVARAG